MRRGMLDLVLPDLLRERTASLHAQAERTAFVREMIAGRVTAARYAPFARSLLEVYEALEHGLQQNTPALAPRELLRAPALARDLAQLTTEPAQLLSAGERYAKRIDEVTEHAPERLIAHAYTRYLGDLAGGALLGRSLSRSLAAEQLSFYRFPEIGDLREYARGYRVALDLAAQGLTAETRRAIAEEAEEAFRLNIALLEAANAHP
jgi:heme oxygenase (biliverdin-producing, ferredoxin)